MAGVVLAAGQGRRMGGPKALVRLGESLLVERASRTACMAGLYPVVVVLGAEADRVLLAADLDGADVVVNDDWASGMASSLRAGLLRLDETAAAAAVVLLVDQPFVGPETIARLVCAWRAGAPVVAAAFAGRLGNPVLFDRSLWTAARRAAVDDRGAGDLLRSGAIDVTAVECGDIARRDDIDTPDDYASAQCMSWRFQTPRTAASRPPGTGETSSSA